MLRAKRTIVTVLQMTTWAAMLFFIVFGVALGVGWPSAMAHFARDALPGHQMQFRDLFLAMLLIGVGIGALVDHIFRMLRAILTTAIEGLPFVPVNAVRLRSIAGSLLAIQLIDLIYAWIVHAMTPIVRYAPSWSPSSIGWIAVVLLFALAQVFGQGTAMQTDLEGTV